MQVEDNLRAVEDELLWRLAGLEPELLETWSFATAITPPRGFEQGVGVRVDLEGVKRSAIGSGGLQAVAGAP
jgi:hypothetical protein